MIQNIRFVIENGMHYYFKIILFSFLFFFKVNAEPIATDQEWERRIDDYFVKTKTPFLAQLRFYTYLYAAQNDAVNSSEQIQNDLIPRLVQRFYPDFVISDEERNLESDPLTDQILCKYFVRMKQEELNTHTFPANCWFKKIPTSVGMVQKWIAWTPPPLPEPPPPLPREDKKGWAAQIGELQKIRRALTPQQREILFEWAGHHGPGANWRVILNQYMEEHATPLAKALLVRSILMKGLYDGMIAEMDAKYSYCIPRPYMMYPEFRPLIKRLKTPSYPSGHAIQGGIVDGILSHFFPEEASYWHQLDVEGANTRLWAGVHFPEDIEQGRILGRKVAQVTLSSMHINGNERGSDAPQEELQGQFQNHF